MVAYPAKNHPQQVNARGPSERDDDRRTPRALFDAFDREFRFDLDVAASHENALCSDYCTAEGNGLTYSWVGRRVWCNPPYSHLQPWVEKALGGSLIFRGDCPIAVLLLPANRTEQPFWQEMIEPHRDRGLGVETRFVRGRQKFGYPDGHPVLARGKGNAPPFGVVVVVFYGSHT